MAGVETSLSVAAAFGLVSVMLLLRFKVDGTAVEDLTPSSLWTPPSSAARIGMDEGPVKLTIEYLIDPAQAAAFRAVMRESRHSRLRQGAVSWSLLRDAGVPGRYLEVVVDGSWAAHLRRFDRVTVADESLRQRRLAFHVGTEPPVVMRWIPEAMEEVDEAPLARPWW
ncbi:MFS transporter [Aquabacterium sp. J223]|uniref:MFS transporter n=1 Tax=Aquabacterium sp. J223 TaxID=2898431 RepID=UPI0021AD8CF9|nr:MFS transporter [Aquabacterium sp. J223]